MEKFKTLKYTSSSYLKDKGSKFWSYAFPVNSYEEVERALADIKHKHPSSGHYCYAYKLLTGKDEVIRANDDGEPKGSAGLPILNQIRSADITNTLIVVAREFGGTKLGISGLINAYKTAAIDAIKNGEIIENEIQVRLQLKFKFDILGEVRSIIDKKNIHVYAATYSDFVCFILEINKSEIAEKRKLFDHLPLEIDIVDV